MSNLPQLTQSDIVIPNTYSPQKAVEYINSYIKDSRKQSFGVDISFMNIIDACYVSTLCSTGHYIDFPEGKIHWYVSSDIIKEYCKNMSLGNSEYICK